MPLSGRIAAGARIEHPDLGAGTVRRTRRDGRALMVRFDSHPSLLLEVRAREVRLAAVPAPKTAPRPEKTPATGLARPAPRRRQPFRRPVPLTDADAQQARLAGQTIEALRLGVVPCADLRPSSVGREAEMGLVVHDLDTTSQAGAARVFLGDYGSGKTHLLELIEREALGRGFLVGRATLDPHYVRPNHPMRVYRTVVSSLRYPHASEATRPGLEVLLQQAIADEELTTALREGTSPLAEHLYLHPALHYYRALADLDDPVPRELLIDWLSGQRPEGNQDLDATLRRLGGRGPRIYALKDFQPWAHVYAYLLGGLGVLARELGYAGFVVLLDEAENYDLLGTAARAFADSVFRCLVLAAMGPDGVRFDESALKKGGFPPQKRLPLVFRWPQHLYLVSAMTPSTAGETLLRELVAPERLTELNPLSPEDYQELSRRLTTVFQAAYPEMQLPEALDRPLGDILWALIRMQQIRSPREATKLTVEFLDLLRLRPNRLDAFFADVSRAMEG